MAKIHVMALLLAALVATGYASDIAAPRRTLLAAVPAYTCSQAKLLQGTGCAEMLACLKTSYPTLTTPSNQKLFATACASCASGTTTCKGDALPDACKAGLSLPPLISCVNKLLPAAVAMSKKTTTTKTTTTKTTTATVAPHTAGGR